MIIVKRSASLHQFYSKEHLKKTLEHLEKVAATDYEYVRALQYKRNLLTAIDREFSQFPELTKGLKMRIQMMASKDFFDLVNNNEAFVIRNQYYQSAHEKLEHVQEMRDVLGLKHKSVYDDDIVGEYMDNY